MAGKIFINYRRGDDPGFAQALYARLEQAFPPDRLFMDVDGIAPGLDFVRVLEQQVAASDVMLSIIGKSWIQVRAEDGARRLDNPEDYVRIEIESALQQGKRVIPVLVGEAVMPRSDELPEGLKPLATRNAVRLSNERFRADAHGVVQAVQHALEEAEDRRRAQAEAEAKRKREEEDRQRKLADEKRRQTAEERRREQAAAKQQFTNKAPGSVWLGVALAVVVATVGALAFVWRPWTEPPRIATTTLTTVTIGGVSVNLPTPAGFCELSAGKESDNHVITLVSGELEKSGNKLLAMSADCRQLADWRSGERQLLGNYKQLLDDYEQYQTAIAGMDKPPTETVQQTCATMRAEEANQVSDVKARVENTLKNIKMNESSFLGVLGEEPTACYAGMIQKMPTEAGTDKTQFTMFAVTIVKNRSLFVYRFTVYLGLETINAAFANLKANLRALAAANR